MKKQRIPVILDCDPGHDDAIALLWLLGSEKFDLLALTTVSGNQTIEKVTKNAANLLSFAGYDDIPIGMGHDSAILGKAMTGVIIHGESGLDGPSLKDVSEQREYLPAIKVLHDSIVSSHEPVTIIATGPLTNIAKLLIVHPELKEKIKVISIMGGGTYGNWTPAAEFNIWVDPEAAKIVFDSQLPIVMAALDVTQQAYIKDDENDELKKYDNKICKYVAELIEFYRQYHYKVEGFPGCTLHDPCAVAALIDESLFQAIEVHVEVETCGRVTRGATVIDKIDYDKKIFGLGKTKNVKFLTSVDRSRFKDRLFKDLQNLAHQVSR